MRGRSAFDQEDFKVNKIAVLFGERVVVHDFSPESIKVEWLVSGRFLVMAPEAIFLFRNNQALFNSQGLISHDLDRRVVLTWSVAAFAGYPLLLGVL